MAILLYNKLLISTAFAALVQTLQNEPEMIKAIYNIPIANDDERQKDNDNSITQYLESNKDNLLDLAEKNYQNLIEALTKNALNAACASSLNPTLSLPQSSSTFNVGPDNQSDIFRIKESETYHNSKGNSDD
jgi:hypothetical protein